MIKVWTKVHADSHEKIYFRYTAFVQAEKFIFACFVELFLKIQIKVTPRPQISCYQDRQHSLW